MARQVVSVESRIEQVTVYASGARVRRVATLQTPLPPVVRFDGLPLSVIDGTVRSEVDEGAVVTALRAGLDSSSEDIRTEESPELRAARRRQVISESEVERLQAALERIGASSIVEEDPSDEEPAAWGAVLAARRSLVAIRATRELTLREQLSAAHREHSEAERALEVAVERDRDAGSARNARLHEVRKHVELELEAHPRSTPAPDAEAEAAAATVEPSEVTIRIEYQVAAARWAPSYVARLEPDSASFELRAVVAQNSGEDWTAVALRLSTAEPEQFAELPELQAQKIGRRQQEPVRRGFRPPPIGADALYADYDHGFPRRSTPITTTVAFDDAMYDGRMPMAPAPPAAPKLANLAEEVWDEDSSRSKEMYPVVPPAAAMMRRKSAGGMAGAVAGAIAAPFALAAQAVTRSAAPPPGAAPLRREPMALPAPTPRLDYGNLLMAQPSSPDRGKLVEAPRRGGDQQSRVEEALDKIEALVLPPGHVDDWVHTYDYAFVSDGAIDVRSDAAWHSIALTQRTGKVAIRHVAVPREQPDVFRVAALANPFDGPLLPGPIDVYDRGQFLVTSEVDYTPPGGTVDVGLGVDPAVKIARNVEFREEAAGMLRGALRLFHAITIEVENLSRRDIEIEVRERIPVTREGEDDIEVAIGKVDPPWERWTPDADAPREARLRGGYRWAVTVPPTSKKELRAGYDVKIPSKLELVGGNRREP